MEILVLITAALAISVFYGAVTLAVLINLNVVPRPEPDEVAAWLDWHRSPRVYLLQSNQVASPAFTNRGPGGSYIRVYALAANVTIPFAIGDMKPALTMPGSSGETGAPTLMVRLPAA